MKSVWLAAFLAFTPFIYSFHFRISSGDIHTAAMTKEGSLFTIELYAIAASIVAGIVCRSILRNTDKVEHNKIRWIAALLFLPAAYNLLTSVHIA